MLSGLPRRERLLIGASLCGIALLAWFYTAYEARRMNATGMCECMRMKISRPELSSWPTATLLPLFLMWVIMMIAMMLPSALPMILTFVAVARNRQRLGRPYIPMSIFVLGYIVIWCLFSALAANAKPLIAIKPRPSILCPTPRAASAGVPKRDVKRVSHM